MLSTATSISTCPIRPPIYVLKMNLLPAEVAAAAGLATKICHAALSRLTTTHPRPEEASSGLLPRPIARPSGLSSNLPYAKLGAGRLFVA